MFATLSGAMMAATRTDAPRPQATRTVPATRFARPAHSAAPKRLLHRLKASLTGRSAAL
jgi:hypothetical protein